MIARQPVVHSNGLPPHCRCDIYCRVIDNYGDAGVCWRLAKQLASEFDYTVRLYIDDLRPLFLFEPALSQQTEVSAFFGIEIHQWQTELRPANPASLIILAFACRLPDETVEVLAKSPRQYCLVNLEYLSAESWIESCHGLPSPDPATGLETVFFFPGFTPKSGGLIRESCFSALQKTLQSDEEKSAFLRSIGYAAKNRKKRVASLFCYPQSPFTQLLSVDTETHWLTTDAIARDIAKATGKLPDNLQIIPFLSQTDFDRLLLSCALNFVRGEDSFVRAHWAETPMVWQPYRQRDDAHRDKLDAFLALYLQNAPTTFAETVSAVWRFWNGTTTIQAEQWADFLDLLPNIQNHNAGWSAQLQTQPNLAQQLVTLHQSRI